MTDTPMPVRPLPDHEIHICRTHWDAGIGEAAFAPLLAGYAGADMPAIMRAEHGKPYLPAPFDTLGFNWSHSGNIAAIAIGRGPAGFELGIDVERVRPRPRALELARRFFAPDETAMLEALPDEDQLRAFLTFWTAKEAVLKAHGGGLSYGLHKVAFELIADGSVWPHVFDGEVGPASSWQVQRLEWGEDLAAAVAWRGRERAIQTFTFAL